VRIVQCLIIAFVGIALTPFQLTAASEPWETEPTAAQLTELRQAVKKLGGHTFSSASAKGDESFAVPADQFKELPPLIYRCNVCLTEFAVDEDLKHLAKHPGIRSLNLCYSKVTVEGIKTIAVLKGLRRLDVSWSTVTDDYLPEISRLPLLEGLNLVGTKVTGDGLRHLEGCKLLKLELPQEARNDVGLKHTLAASATFERLESCYDWPQVTDEGLRALEGCESLTSFSWWTGKKIGPGFRHVIPTLKNLRQLNLGGAGVVDDDLKLLAGLHELESLDLGGNGVTDAGLKHLSHIKSLRTLVLGGTQVTDEGMQLLAILPQLRELYLANSGITDDGLKHLANAPELRRLHLERTRITESGMKPFVGRTLQDVYLDDKLYTESVFLAIAPNLGPGDNWELRRWPLTDIGLKEIAKQKGPHTLKLRGEFTAAGFRHLAAMTEIGRLELVIANTSPAAFAELAGLPKLGSLEVAGDVTDEMLDEISKLSRLSGVGVTSSRVTEKGLKSLARLRNLEGIWLGTTITEAGMAALATLPKLKTLSMRETDLSDAGLLALGKSPSIKWIDLTYTNVTERGAQAFKKLRPKCVLYDGE